MCVMSIRILALTVYGATMLWRRSMYAEHYTFVFITALYPSWFVYDAFYRFAVRNKSRFVIAIEIDDWYLS